MHSRTGVISLRSREPISRGSFRACYLHPEDDGRVIKIVHRHEEGSRNPSDPNLRELSEYERLIAAGAPIRRYFPQIYGLLETDLGPGLCAERLYGAHGDGKIPTVIDAALKWLGDGLSVAPIVKGIEGLMAFCIEHEILASCYELRNMGVVVRDGAEVVMGYDVKVIPNKEFLPLATHFSFFRRKKIARKFQRALSELEGILEGARRQGDFRAQA